MTADRLHRAWWKRADAPLDCKEVARVLQSFLDGELPHADAASVADHLEICRLCGLETDTYLLIKSAIFAAADEPVVDDDTLTRLRRFGERLARGEDPSAP